MREYYQARASWHDEYMGYTGNAAMEKLLEPIVLWLEGLIADLTVLEVACGTGNWTQVLAKRARRVLATDVCLTALDIAKTKDYPLEVVAFQAADAYNLDGLPRGFEASFAADWWSHVPRSLLPRFLNGLHRHLKPGARVVFVDMLSCNHPDLKSYRLDDEGNAICRRTLPDGRVFDVVKNYPSRAEALELLIGISDAPEYREWLELGRWALTYQVLKPNNERKNP